MAIDATIDRELIAAARIDAGRSHDLVATVLPADTTLRGGDVLAALPVGDRSLWWQPEADLVVVGSGAAATLRAPAPVDADQPARFSSVPLGALSVGVADPHEIGVSPRLVGGFSFFADDTWESFGSGELRLPAIAYVRHGDDAAWIVTTPATDRVDVVGMVERVSSRLLSSAWDLDTGPDPVLELVEPGRDRSRDLIATTIAEIRAGRFEKVVLARTVTIAARIDVPRLVEVLVDRHAECATFAFERNGEWFAGATPELLVGKSGSIVTSAALAATAPRHADPVLDRIELDSLQTTKQLEEHRLVVEAVVASLERLGIQPAVLDQRVMDLRNVRHLATAIEGFAPEGVDILDLVGALHPTPAVGGVPGSGALEWIRRNEGFSRGWYAGPVGVLDLEGDGEFRVALRSARITESAIHLYAGAGIVAGSDPDAEMDEIDLKLGVMAGAVAAAG